MDPLEHYLWIGQRLGRRHQKQGITNPSGSEARELGLPQRNSNFPPQQSSSRHSDTSYWALRQEVLESGLYDEKWYLSRYYECYINSKINRPRNEPFFPLDYYLQEGWRHGHEPSRFLPIQVDQRQVGCSKIEYFLNHLRFSGYQFDENIWIPREELIRSYVSTRPSRSSDKVIYTCIMDNYDELMQPYHIQPEWDYVCFTDNSELIRKGSVGVWEIRPVPAAELDSVRKNRWCKMHPHVLFPSHAESIYIDGNINIISGYIFNQISTRNSNILLPWHFARCCAYSEIDILLNRPQTTADDRSLLDSHRDFLEQEGFPRDFGLSENNLIYRRHHDALVIKLMSDWWNVYSSGPSRDQASLSYVFWKNKISLRAHMIGNCRVYYRDFWVVKHSANRKEFHPERLPPSAVVTKSPPLAPAFNRDNVAVVFSTNSAFIPYLGVAIFSLIEHASRSFNYDIIILAKGLPETAFSKICRLAHGRENVSIRIYDTTELIQSLPENVFYIDGYVPIETYNKCFITHILSSAYDRCLYLDSDILVLADVQELHNIDLRGCSIGASPNIANINAAFCKKEIKGNRFDEYIQNKLGIYDYNKYFQAGVLVLDMRRLRDMDLPSRAIEALESIRRPIFFDQCVFNKIFYGDVHLFSTCWNHVWYMQQYSYLRGSVPDSIFFDYARGRVDPKIVHFASADKPHTKSGWVLSDLFWKYAYASPFIDEIRRDVLSRDNDVARTMSAASDGKWYEYLPRVLVHVHLYYREQIDFIMESLNNICKCKYDLYITMTERHELTERRILCRWKEAKILIVQNVGYDVFPFLHVLKQVRLSNYDFVLKIHTKNARGPGEDYVYGIRVPGYRWRDELIRAIIGSKAVFERNLQSFINDKKLGCIGAGRFIFSTRDNNEEQNYNLPEWRRRCGVEGGSNYIGGSMFFARAYPFERLKALNMQPKDFESRHMRTKDSKNTAHIFERLFGIVIESEGFEIRGDGFPSRTDA